MIVKSTEKKYYKTLVKREAQREYVRVYFQRSQRGKDHIYPDIPILYLVSNYLPFYTFVCRHAELSHERATHAVSSRVGSRCRPATQVCCVSICSFCNLLYTDVFEKKKKQQ